MKNKGAITLKEGLNKRLLVFIIFSLISLSSFSQIVKIQHIPLGLILELESLYQLSGH